MIFWLALTFVLGLAHGSVIGLAGGLLLAQGTAQWQHLRPGQRVVHHPNEHWTDERGAA